MDGGSIPPASIPERSPLRLAPQHDDFARIIFSREVSTDAGEAGIGGWLSPRRDPFV